MSARGRIKCEVCNHNHAVWSRGGETPSRCGWHREDHVVHVATGSKAVNLCSVEDCNEIGTHGYPRMRYDRCLAHSLPGQDKVTKVRVCLADGCDRAAIYRPPGLPPLHCHIHKQEGDTIRIGYRKGRGKTRHRAHIKSCTIPGCWRAPVCRIANMTYPTRCDRHATTSRVGQNAITYCYDLLKQLDEASDTLGSIPHPSDSLDDMTCDDL